MKLCFSTLVCPNWSFPEIVGAAAAHGIRGIDLRGLGHEIDVTRTPRFSDPELTDTLQLLHRHGLEVPCLATSIALITPAAEPWSAMLDDCHRHAVLAGRCASPFMRVFGGPVPKNMSRDEAVGLARRHLRQLVKICAPHRCRVLLETHGDWALSADIAQIIAGFPPDEAGILWDIEHPCRRGEPPEQTAATLRGHIQHIHIKDSMREGGHSVPRVLGDGELPLTQMIQSLKSIRYDGWICLETEKRWHPDAAPEPEESIPQFVHFMREVWGDRD